MEIRDLLLAPDLSEAEAAKFLEQLGFRDGLRADRCLRDIADLVSSRERLADLFVILSRLISRTADPDLALLQLQHFFEASSDPSALTLILLDHPATLEVLIGILAASPHLSQILFRNPEFWYWLIDGDRLTVQPPADYFSRTLQVPVGLDQAGALDWLRRTKRRETLRIAAQDLLGHADFTSTIKQISALASAVLERVFEVVRPLPTGRFPFAVLAFGKLGGRELNYSSDIDLLYVYSDDAEPESMLRFARNYTQALTDFTGEGRLYRVDLRLRPMGSSGQIAYPVTAFRQYYETSADTFDRLALIKCTWVAGDEGLGKQFGELAESFVYRKYLDLAAIDEIRWLKRKTDRKLSRRGETRRNVKLGVGGIREIEFFVQSFQLLYGGLHPELRTPNTLAALDRLVDSGYIHTRDFQTLREAYVFLRTVEHHLQLVHDLQTHSLPDDPVELERCARRMGYGPTAGRKEETFDGFLATLDDYRQNVRHIFESLFEDQAQSGLSDVVLNPSISPEEALRLLSAEGVPSPEDFHSGLQQILQAPAFPYNPARVRNLLANLLPRLIEQSRICSEPRPLLSRFDRFCEALGARADFYTTLNEHGDFAARFFRVLSAGEFLSETLIRFPELLDSISRRPDFESDPEQIRQLRGFSGSTEPFLNLLCRFKRRQEFKLAAEFLESRDDTFVRRELTRLAEVALGEVSRRLVSEDRELGLVPFVLLALGKFGGRELTFHSDLDLILVFDDSGSTRTAHRLDQFLRRLTQAMQTYTESGKLYQIDFRLRPEGRRSALATPLGQFRNYLQGRVQAWERLAYVKLRSVFRNQLDLDLKSLLGEARFCSDDLRQLLHIRSRKENELAQESKQWYDFKVGRGGLMDIQFALQYLQIQSACPEVSSQEAIGELVERGQLGAGEGQDLRDSLAFLFNLETAVRLLTETPTRRLPRQPERNCLLANLLGLPDAHELLSAYERVTESVRLFFEKKLVAHANQGRIPDGKNGETSQGESR